MDPGAGAAGQYVLTTPQKSRGRKKATTNVPVGFTSSYDPTSKSVTLALFKPTRNALVLTVRGTVTAANGATLGGNATLRIQ
jgi:hypothetical protein